ncbi:related to phosphatase 2a inhibitor [Rhynchosporium graminicola]|uniref:Related to phosphatase 2a inhibitor n=1 Tax=Rhynchosporium graminicola TaxID=2792576 RepID=A0A1E1KVV3_9HELO|nr:related to phosphatase 2a inhibitor [Rhynchosporium commune]
MSAGLEETPVSYEDLADIEKEFDDVETEIIRQQIALSNPLYERRSKTVSQIPNFWPLVLEQAPPDIDQYIQPSDSALLLSSLLSISEGRDLTGGLLELVIKAWETEQKASAASSAGAKANGKADKERLTPEQKILKRKIGNTGMGGLSFFAWFGFIGRKISEEESREAMRIEKEKREKRKAAKSSSEAPESTGEEEEEEEEDEEEGQDPEAEEDQDIDLEIFPDGDDLAIAITEDLWPSAIKYFTQAQEQDALSDADFESDDNEGNAEVEVLAGDRDAENEDRPKKKQRSS